MDPAALVDATRIERLIAAFGRLGRSPSGLHRPALSPAEERAHTFLQRVAASCDLASQRDAIGNTRVRLEHGGPPRPPVLCGSHLDTVPDGGVFDGVVGVVCGLEALIALRSCGASLARPVEAVAFVGEESSRFGIATIGSGLLTGQLDADDTLRREDEAGISVAEALRRLGRDPERASVTRLASTAAHAFVEVHVEQGPRLAAAGLDLGIVTDAVGFDRIQVDLDGRAQHSGATPMSVRHDALGAAAEIILEVERVGREAEPRDVVATATVFHVRPNAMNVVPAHVDMRIDLRGPSDLDRATILAHLEAHAERVARDRGVRISITRVSRKPAVAMSAMVAGALGRAAAREGCATVPITSPAGHDAVNLAAVCPTGMLFVQSIAGISHHPDEETPLEAILRAARVLTRTVFELALA